MSQDVAAEISNVEQKQEPEKLFEPFGRGIIRDFKMRLPFIKSDITDGFNSQVRKKDDGVVFSFGLVTDEYYNAFYLIFCGEKISV